MKKMMCLGVLMASAAAGLAQESRQDASISALGKFAPFVNGTGGNKERSTDSLGFLGSYRYMLTPRSALEANYSFTQYDSVFTTTFVPIFRVRTRQQEVSVAYVYSFNFRNLNPFVEVGPAALLFSPVHDFSTTTLDTKRTTGIGALFGAGIAYEISPSFDIRAQYRGVSVKVPSFGAPNIQTNRYEVISMPTIGVAYHF